MKKPRKNSATIVPMIFLGEFVEDAGEQSKRAAKKILAWRKTHPKKRPPRDNGGKGKKKK
jgi:hypothetical protein